MDAQEAFGIGAPCQIIANACASGTNAIGHAFNCVRSGRYQRVLTGGYDAISELVFVGFDSLQASTPDRCRPFDRERSGMVLGEGAAVLALENLESAKKRGATILGEIIGYGISTDNFHLTQPDPSGNGCAPGHGGRLAKRGNFGRGNRLYQCARNRDAVQRRRRRQSHRGIVRRRAGQFHERHDGPLPRGGGSHRSDHQPSRTPPSVPATEH